MTKSKSSQVAKMARKYGVKVKELKLGKIKPSDMRGVPVVLKALTEMDAQSARDVFNPEEWRKAALNWKTAREKEAQTARDVFWNEIEEWKRKERERKPSDNESLVEELRKDVSDIQDICASKDRRNESLVEELRKECDMWKAKAEEMMAEWKAEVKTISTKVYVVMGNDYPDEVFANEIAAELYCKMQRDERPTAGVTLGRRIYWRVYPFTVKGRQT